MIAATIFMCIFVIIGGIVMYLSKTIEHGEARFDASGKVISEKARKTNEEVRPAQRIEDNTTKAQDDE